MSLATRCAACGTVFRVVQDQLKVSEGWVRCGRCGDVFNALEGLFDLERETAPAWTPSQRGALDLLPASADEHAAQSAAIASRDDTDSSTAQDTAIDTRIDSRVDESPINPDLIDNDVVGRGEAMEADATDEAESLADSTAVPDAPPPSFLRRAEGSVFWQQPRVRLALMALGAALGMGLLLQALHTERDLIAARWPITVPLLSRLCDATGCVVEPLRHLEGLAVESSGLTQLESPALYRLQVALRNRDATPLLTPALDVTLTDGRGEVVARRVLGASDFGTVTPRTVAPGAELALQVVLDAGDRRIAGYSVEVFYP